MKRVVLFIVALVSIVLGANALAQSRTKVGDGVYLVMYGNKAIIEDDNNQRSISVEIFQESINRQTSQKIYKVVCGKWTKRVVKDGLKAGFAPYEYYKNGEVVGVDIDIANEIAKELNY